MPLMNLKKSQAIVQKLEPKIDQLSTAYARRLADAYANLATLYTDQGRLDLALATIEGALGLLPESTQLIDSLAEIHSRYAVLYKEVARRQRVSQKTP
jgi:hypothetical protein